jgi:hypothetical protein
MEKMIVWKCEWQMVLLKIVLWDNILILKHCCCFCSAAFQWQPSQTKEMWKTL